MELIEIVGVTLNAGILSIFYTTIGGVISYLLSLFVDTETTKWQSRPLWYQLGDVSLQLAIVGILAFWITFIVRHMPPIFHVRKELDILVDTYISGIFFAYALFLFVTYLDTKIRFLYKRIFDQHVERLTSLRKTDKTKSSPMSYQDEL